jgi:hypothetical protein
MANRFVILLSCSMIAVMVLLSFSVLRKKKIKEGQLAFIKNLPSNILNKVQLWSNTPAVFIAFHPNCEHCQYEAKSICEQHKTLAKTQIILFANENDSLTSAFAHEHGLDTLKNVKIICKISVHVLIAVFFMSFWRIKCNII